MTELKRIPPLELAFRVAQLGGWENVQLLTYSSTLVYYHDQPDWCDVRDAEQLSIYMHPEPGMAWHVYDIRKKQR